MKTKRELLTGLLVFSLLLLLPAAMASHNRQSVFDLSGVTDNAENASFESPIARCVAPPCTLHVPPPERELVQFSNNFVDYRDCRRQLAYAQLDLMDTLVYFVPREFGEILGRNAIERKTAVLRWQAKRTVGNFVSDNKQLCGLAFYGKPRASSMSPAQ